MRNIDAETAMRAQTNNIRAYFEALANAAAGDAEAIDLLRVQVTYLIEEGTVAVKLVQDKLTALPTKEVADFIRASRRFVNMCNGCRGYAAYNGTLQALEQAQDKHEKYLAAPRHKIPEDSLYHKKRPAALTRLKIVHKRP